MEVLQCAFWNLDPARTVAKFEAFAHALGGAEARTFVMLEDWANDGPPLSEAAARELFEDLFRDDLTGAGRWQVDGATIDPAALAMPLLNIVSTSDRIVPAATACHAPASGSTWRSAMSAWWSARAPARASGSRSPAGFPALQQAARGPHRFIPVRAEPVEAHNFPSPEEGKPFDRLRANGGLQGAQFT